MTDHRPVIKMLRVKQLLIFILFIFTLSLPTQANEDLYPDQNSNNSSKLSALNPIGKFDACPTSSDTEALLREFHLILSGDTTRPSFKDVLKKMTTWAGLKDWVKSFNLKRGITQACRYYNIRSVDHRVKDHVANLAFILPLSQGIEMLAGPTLSSLSIAAHWPSYVTGTISVIGTIISLPGIDPVCIIMYSSYPFSPVQSSITALRRATVSTFGFIGTITGVTALGRILSDQWNLKKIRDFEGDITFTSDSLSLTISRGSKLIFYWDSTRTYFTGMSFNTERFLRVSPEDFDELLKPLPTNLRLAVAETHDYLSGRRPPPFYLASEADLNENVKLMTWTPHAVRSKYLARCADLLLAEQSKID